MLSDAAWAGRGQRAHLQVCVQTAALFVEESDAMLGQLQLQGQQFPAAQQAKARRMQWPGLTGAICSRQAQQHAANTLAVHWYLSSVLAVTNSRRWRCWGCWRCWRCW